jgi:hypothetical protein
MKKQKAGRGIQIQLGWHVGGSSPLEGDAPCGSLRSTRESDEGERGVSGRKHQGGKTVFPVVGKEWTKIEEMNVEMVESRELAMLRSEEFNTQEAHK